MSPVVLGYTGGSSASDSGITVSGSFRYPWIIDVAHVYIDCSAEKFIGPRRFLFSAADDERRVAGSVKFEASSRVDCLEA